MRTWIGFDLDGTLAKDTSRLRDTTIGEPIPVMVEKAKRYIEAGEDVRLFTARAYRMTPDVEGALKEWCKEHLGKVIPIQAHKDHELMFFYDDRCRCVHDETEGQ